MDYCIEDFTEAGYGDLIRLAGCAWRFIGYRDYETEDRVALWRHDIDFSVHRALRTALIEEHCGVTSTYFLYLHSTFYNIFEAEIRDLVMEIVNLGHDIGLHFDAGFHRKAIDAGSGIEDLLLFEKNVVESLFGVEVGSFSLHNPGAMSGQGFHRDRVGGMINAYGPYLREHYAYVSDSNGYWRHRRLKDVLSAGEDDRLHVLTHPGWWVPEAMSPRHRVSRCIDGRALKQHARYDRALEEHGRTNVGR